jgi:hypothetical protein
MRLAPQGKRRKGQGERAQTVDIAREHTRPKQSPSTLSVIPANAGIQEGLRVGNQPDRRTYRGTK